MSLYSGQHFGSYEIIKILGSGGMGEVYLARDTRLNRQVAIKILSASLTASPETLARFRKEAGLAAVLNHPNICTIYETGEVDGRTYICMEYVEGKTLRDRIVEEPIPLSDVLDIAIQIADALEEARTKNIIHRDIKSLNILLTSRGRVKVLDFGLAKQLQASGISDWSGAATQSSLSQSGDVRGTPAYMSPEQALGKTVDHRSDIFSFGVVLYEMLTGRIPFTGSSTTEVVDAILHKSPVPVTRYNDGVSPELILVLNKMLEKDPDMRYQSVHEVWVDLRRIKGESTAQGTRPGRRVRLSWIRSPATILAVVLIIAALVAGWMNMSLKGTKPRPDASMNQQEKISIAVLPFRYVGDDPTRQYLGTLVTDGLIAGLQPVPSVAIAPYANVREIKDTNSIRQIARDLGVQWIIRGTVALREQNAEITPEVIGQNGVTVWKETLTGRPVSTLDVAKKSILRALHLSETVTKEIEQVRTPNVEAYRKYLEARNRHQGWDEEGNLDDAIRLYREALEKDPDFAAARAGLAIALLSQFDQKREAPLLSSANEEAQRALGLDPNLPEVLIAYGMVHAQSGNSIEARDAFVKALELAPGDDSACRSLAGMYSLLGRNQEAEAMYKQAVALRPSFWRNHYALGTFEWQYAGDLDAARVHLEKAVELHPEGYAPLVMMGNLHLTQGRLQEAETYFRKALERSQNASAYNNLGLVYYYRGQYDLALRNWQAVLKDAPDKPMYQANVADALRQLGRVEEAKDRYMQVIEGFRADLKINPSDDKTRASLAMALSATGLCKEASAETRGVLSRHPESPELAAYAAITVSRCADLKWAKQIVLNSIAADNLLMIRFDPDLEPVRRLPEVKQALARAARPTASELQ